MKPEIGIMQGRLSPPVCNRIQAFPGDNWKREFFTAREMGLASVEWIFESPVDQNPVWALEGVAEIRTVVEKSGTRVDFLCADYFMESPLIRISAENLTRNHATLNKLIEHAARLGAKGIEIPFVDASAIQSVQEEDELCRALAPCLDVAHQRHVLIGLETSLPPNRFEKLLRRLDHPAIRANYDIGNSASLGYIPDEEIASYGTWINNIHIKDRVRNGGTVLLGTGDADLPHVFHLLREMKYTGSYTLQAARGPDEVNTVRQYLDKVRQWI